MTLTDLQINLPLVEADEVDGVISFFRANGACSVLAVHAMPREEKQ